MSKSVSPRVVAWYAAFLGLVTPCALALEIASPSGDVTLSVAVEEGELRYRVRLGGQVIIAPSSLGMVTEGNDFSQGVSIVSESEPTDVVVEYEHPLGKVRSVHRTMRAAELTVADADGAKLDILLRVADDGVAFAYRFDEVTAEPARVTHEATTFALPAGSTGFLHPMAVSKSGWSRTQPSYEEHYSIDQPVGEPSSLGKGWCFPALFRISNVGWALVSETGVDGGYCGMHLGHDSSGGVYRMAMPQQEDHTGNEDPRPEVAPRQTTPWRFIVVGRTLAPIVESTWATDLVEPRFDSDPPKPGRAAWSWLKLKDGETIEQVQRDFIDMAASLDWEYVLIDAMWDQQIGREKIAELVSYARLKGVDILLWYNSNGMWNDAPQTPKNRMHESGVREEEMAWLEEIGAKGVKVDFFAGDKQEVMAFYEAILRDGAKHGLSVNFHGTTLPRGWSRMYPSFVTNEAVRGMEFMTFEQPDADAQPVHCTVLPFTRNVVGPMDFTPLIVGEKLGTHEGAMSRRTRLSYELALPLLYHSPVTHFGLTPADLELLPAEAVEYLRELPTVWDETRYVAGYPGRYAALARRKGDRWWIAAINGQEEPVTFALPDEFDSLRWSTILDAGFNEVSGGEHAPGASVTLEPSGGVVMWAEAE